MTLNLLILKIVLNLQFRVEMIIFNTINPNIKHTRKETKKEKRKKRNGGRTQDNDKALNY